MKKVINMILEFILNIFVGIAILILIFTIYYNIQIKILDKKYVNVFGYTFFEVATGSMSGTLDVGDIIIVKITKQIKTNDIIVYKKYESYITHRVIEIENNKIITKGDANNTNDEPIGKEDVVGKVVKVFKNIKILKKVLKSPSVLIPIIITMILIGIAIIYKPKENGG